MSRTSMSAALCLIAGITGAISGLVLALIEPAVDATRYSYPLSSEGFVGVQIWFGLHHVGLLLGLLALRWSGVVPSTRPARIGWGLSVIGMIGLTLTEFAAVVAAGAGVEDPIAGTLGAVYGLDTLLLGVGLTMLGVSIWRAGSWSGWRRGVVLALGAWVFVVLFPVLIVWPADGARLAIGAWMLLFALLGAALVVPARWPVAMAA